MNRPYCYAPWLGLSLRQDGEWKPCGAYQESLGKIQSTSSVSFGALQDLKNHLLAHQPPAGCNLCLREESEGRTSKRLKIHDHVQRKGLFKSLEELTSSTPTHLELAFSNRCNFTCAMCSSEYSSSWRTLAEDYALTIDQQKKSDLPVFQVSDEQLENLLHLSGSIQTLQILGGEPLYEKQFHKYLVRLSNINPNCDVCVATNGSLLSPQFIDTLNGFKSGSLDLSIDGTGKVFEYVRGFSFEKLETKLQLLENLQRHILVSIFFSPSLYNFFDLPNFIHWGDNLKTKYPHLKFRFRFDQIVSQPAQLSCLLAPQDLRKSTAEKIRREMVKVNWQNKDLESFSNYLERPFETTPDLLSLAQKTAHFFNSNRGFRLWDIFPQMLFLAHLPRLQTELVHH